MCTRPKPWMIFLFLLLALPPRAPSQAPPTYTFTVPVDEVILTFHATGPQGLPANDLKLNDLSLIDNGLPPRKILEFRIMQDFPIHAGILIDTSESMSNHLPGDRAIAIEFAQSLLRQQTDQAYLMDFGRLSRIQQPWTGNSPELVASLRRISTGTESHTAGTAIFDTIYRTCLNQFGKIDPVTSRNVILLFSDGEDNASTMLLKDAVDMCQRTNTAIYAFRAQQKPGSSSTGPQTLTDLTSQTGGRVFPDDASEADLQKALQIIESSLRNQYRLVYRPSALKHDGSFHSIHLETPKRFDSITVRSGYYAPTH